MSAGGRGMKEFSRIARAIRCRGTCVVVVLMGVLASYAQTSGHSIQKSKQATQSLASGKRTFESSCASCHGLNGKGAERAPDIATRSEIVKLSDPATLKVLREGVPAKGMPSFAELGSARLSDLLNYLRALQGKGQVPASTANSKRGKELFCRQGGLLTVPYGAGRGRIPRSRSLGLWRKPLRRRHPPRHCERRHEASGSQGIGEGNYERWSPNFRVG